jgi:predicted metalloendopeptidase
MKKQTAVEWLTEKLRIEFGFAFSNNILEQAKEMERKEKIKHQLFIGKVHEIIGFKKTVELLKECNETFEP